MPASRVLKKRVSPSMETFITLDGLSNPRDSLHQKDGALRKAYHFVSLAPHQQPLQQAQSPGTHHDQVASLGVGGLNNGLGSVTEQQFSWISKPVPSSSTASFRLFNPISVRFSII